MALLVPNQGEKIMLEAILNKVAPQDLDMKLYSNDKTPADGDTEADYTEVEGAGYAEKELVAANWNVVAGAPTEATYPEQTFTFTGAVGDVYGYYIVQRTSGKLVWAERFTTLFFGELAGDILKVTAKFQGKKAGE